MPGLDLLEFRHGGGALFFRVGAAGAEGATGGSVQGAGNVAGEDDALILSGGLGVRQRNGRHEALGIGMQGVVVNFLCVRQLYHFTKIHNGDSVGNVTDHQKIVGDEQVGQAHLVLEFIKHIDDLGLDGYVQGGHRLVADHKLRVHGHSPGNADALPLAAGELVGVAVGVLRVQAHLGHQLQHPLLPLLLGGVHLVYVQRLGNDIGDGHTRVQ